jgi:threonine/homoserine efflux transporter RhtA
VLLVKGVALEFIVKLLVALLPTKTDDDPIRLAVLAFPGVIITTGGVLYGIL